MKCTGINFKAHCEDNTKVVASVAYQFSKMDGFTDVGCSEPFVAPITTKMPTVSRKVRIHHYPEGCGKMAFHQDGITKDSAATIRFSLLFFASDEMQRCIR